MWHGADAVRDSAVVVLIDGSATARAFLSAVGVPGVPIFVTSSAPVCRDAA